MDAKLLEAIKPYEDYFKIREDGKVECLVNGHCFPANRPEQIAAFVNGARFAKLKIRYDAETALTKYEPFIVVSKNFPHMLYCALTGQLLEKSLAAVKKHMGGKRFVRAKARFVADEQDLKPEPSLREFGIILPGEEDDGKGDDGRKSKKQRKAGAATGDEDGEMAEPDGQSEDEDSEEPAFWVPPGELGGRATKKGAKGRAGAGAAAAGGNEEEDDDDDDDDDGDEGDSDEGEDAVEEGDDGGSCSMEDSEDAMEADEVGEQMEEGVEATARQERPGPSGRGAVRAHANGVATGAGAKMKQKLKQPNKQKDHKKQEQGGDLLKVQEQQNGLQKQRQKQRQKQEVAAGSGPTEDLQVGQPGAKGKKRKTSSKQRRKAAAAAAAPQPDDFDFEVDANGDVGMTDVVPQHPEPDRPTFGPGAARAGVKPKKKNVNRPAPAKKTRNE
ncbi:hypothetical protein Vretimale_8975 [Volvox reticuliferus]|uniref:Surfeit locus protein 2 n=1 Tax=Volvox reticuliferus TaxID=1737510 RepID=A0A8J4CV92_9CHLO|nr:hypothetical protein Vretifemale_14436 [Volvox reticuliferus]GIM04386.1 hypothetical protein Vretimale_8975 [Volvox reticuliferus]